MIRNIIFDWSGTLVDDLPGVFKATNYILEQAGVATLTLTEFRAEFELPFIKFYNRFTPDVPLEQLEEWFHSYFSKVCGEVIALPHSVEFLDFCKSEKIRCFVLSAVKQEYFTEQTANVGMSDYFEQTYLGVWDKRGKIHDIIEENNLSKGETLYIGDMQHDVETAHHGGVHSCALLTGYNTLDQLREANPTHIATDLDEFKATLQSNGMTLPISKRRPIATVGALIYDALGQVLMVRTDKWSGKWGIPGGKIEHSESSEDALRREITEETSLTITDIDFVLSQDCIDSEEFYRPEHFILLNYTCRAAGETDVTLNDEAQEYLWLSEPDALQLDLNRPTRILLDAVMANSTIPNDA